MRKYLVFLVSIMILASCGSSPPDVTDWCYVYDFATDDYDVNIVDGEWVTTIGLKTLDGLLSFNYDYGQFVSPSVVYITVARPVDVIGDINITTAGTIYGNTASFSATMTTDNETVAFTPENIGDAGTSINVTLDVGSQDLIIESIDVRGNGASPFDENPCSTITPTGTFTPSPTIPATATSTSEFDPTFTPSATFTQTLTLTPSETLPETPTPTNTLNPDPSPTPDPFCANLTCIYDHYEYTDIEINTQEWGYNRTIFDGSASISGGVDGGQTARIGCGGGGCRTVIEMEYTFDSPVSITSVAGWARRDDSYATYNGDFVVAVYFADGSDTLGTGCALVDEDGYSGWYQFDEGVSGCANASSTQRMYVVAGGTRGFQPGSTTTWLDNLIIRLSEAYDPPPTHTPFYTPSPTFTPSVTRTPLITPIPGGLTRTPIGYNSPTPPPTVDLTQTTATASVTPLPSSTPFPTLTYIPSSTPYATAIVEAGTPTPSVEEIRENEAEYELLEEIKENQNWLENTMGNIVEGIGGAFGWFFQGFDDIFAMIRAFFEFLFGLISAIFAIIVEILEIIFLIIQLMLGLLGLLLAYIQQLIARITVLFTAFFTVPPTPINGLPLCVSDPLSYDICAVYYVADWTLFKPQSLGEFIVPLILAIMNVIVIFRAIKYILKFIKRGQDVTV